MPSLDAPSILASISQDRALGSAILFAHKHKDATPDFHVKVMDLWRAADPLVVIEAFREGGKTTLAEEFLLMEAAFGNFKYALIFGETYTKACQRIEAIKHEVASNPKIKSLFGDLKGPVWSENRLLLKNGVLLEAHGWEEEIRGYKHRDMRPDRAYLDDIESSTSVRDTQAVDAGWKKIHLQLIPAMDKDGKVRMTGTPLADDCLVRRATQSEDWTSGRFPICDGDIDSPATVSLWPARYPMEWVRDKRDQFARAGMLREFNQEYMLIATGAQGKSFTEDMLRFEDVAPSTFCPRVVIMDPARTVEVKKSDQTGHVTLSRLGTRIYVHQSGGEYWQPDEIVAGAFAMSRKHDDAQVVIEKNSLDDWLLQPIRAMSLLTGVALDMKPVNAPQDRDKAAFIMGLRPFFMAGDIILVGGRAAHQQLVAQILNFPTGKRDILNALAYALRVFAGIPVYPDFGADNIVERYEVTRADRLLLGCNASGSETTAVLVAVRGRNLTVVADWVSPLLPNDAIPDIAMLIRAAFPGSSVTAWVPADQFDQVGRNPLVTALKAAKLPPHRGEHTAMSRGTLSPSIRTSMGGRRMLLVDSQARATLNALCGQYQFPVKSGGERAAEPERGPARTLLEALESLSLALTKPDETQLVSNSVNSTGTPYLSALPARR
jgi:hypothetical protein